MWSKGKIIQLAQYPINLLPFHFTSIRPTIPEIQLFWNLTLKHPKSRSWVRSMVKVPIYTQYPTDALPFFHINPTNHSWDMAKIAFDLEKTHLKILKKIAKITVFHKTSPKSNHDKGNMATTFCSDWMSGFYFIIQTSKFFANWCHSHDLGSRSWKGHPVHFYRLIYLLSQISKN